MESRERTVFLFLLHEFLSSVNFYCSMAPFLLLLFRCVFLNKKKKKKRAKITRELF